MTRRARTAWRCCCFWFPVHRRRWRMVALSFVASYICPGSGLVPDIRAQVIERVPRGHGADATFPSDEVVVSLRDWHQVEWGHGVCLAWRINIKLDSQPRNFDHGIGGLCRAVQGNRPSSTEELLPHHFFRNLFHFPYTNNYYQPMPIIPDHSRHRFHQTLAAVNKGTLSLNPLIVTDPLQADLLLSGCFYAAPPPPHLTRSSRPRAGLVSYL